MSKRHRRRTRQLFEQQGGLCHWCGEVMHMDARNYNDPKYATQDHIVRRRDGGRNVDNLVAAHKACNEERN